MKTLLFFVGWTLFFTLFFIGVSWLAQVFGFHNAALWISVPVGLIIGLLLGRKIGCPPK